MRYESRVHLLKKSQQNNGVVFLDTSILYAGDTTKTATILDTLTEYISPNSPLRTTSGVLHELCALNPQSATFDFAENIARNNLRFDVQPYIQTHAPIMQLEEFWSANGLSDVDRHLLLSATRHQYQFSRPSTLVTNDQNMYRAMLGLREMLNNPQIKPAYI